MGAFIDLTGQRFGRLLVLSRGDTNKNKCILWNCLCDCGREVAVAGVNMRQGKTASCGCSHYSSSIKFKEKYGDVVKRGCAAHEYSIWLGIKKRCYNTNSRHYDLYGGRGVTMHEEWINDFTAFYEYIGPRPSPKHSVDRIDGNGHYSPGNVRWATDDEQARGHCLHSSNSTGASNVFFRHRKEKGTTLCCAEVSLTQSGMKVFRKSKEFSVQKYGLIPAMALAISWREDQLLKLQEQGIVYSESHGTKRKVIND